MLGSYAIVGCPPADGGRRRRGRPGCAAPTRSRSRSSVTARPTSARSTRRSTWPRCGSCRCCSSARTTSTWSTRRSRSVTAVPNPAADRAPAYGIPAEVIDGNDVRGGPGRRGRRRASGPGRATGRRSSRRETYRHFGHSRTDPAKYRPAEEVEQLAGARPARRRPRPARATLGVDDERDRRRPTSGQRHGRRTAIEAAKAAPAADPAEALTDVWADGGAAVADTERRQRDHLPRGGRRGHRARDAARSRRWSASARTSARPEGVFKTTAGLFKEFGPERVWDTPDLRAGHRRRRHGRRDDRACGRSPRSCSPTSWPAAGTTWPTRSPRCAT